MNVVTRALESMGDTLRSFWNPPIWTRDPALTRYLGYGPTQSGANVTEYTALNYSAWWAALQIISNAIAALPLFLYRRTNAGGDPDAKEKFTSHPLYAILHDAFNREQTSIVARRTMQAHVLGWGNAYAEIERNGSGTPVAIWPLTPDRVRPDRNGNGTLIYRVREEDGTDVILSAEDVVHIKGQSFDGITGYSVVRMAREAIGLGLTTEAFGAEFFANGAASSMVASHPGVLSEQAHARLKQEIVANTTGGKRHSVLLLEEGIKVDKLTIPPEDAQFLATRQFQTLEIARWFNLPPHKLGDLQRATFCLPGDALISTPTGPRPIAELRPGDEVWSRSDTDEWVRQHVEAAGPTGIDQILTIRAGMRTLRCNARHRLPVRRPTLEPWTGGQGQYLTHDGKRYRQAWQTEIVPAGEIQVGDQLLALQGLPDTDNDQAPTRRASVPFMEILGLLIGDGFFARRRHGGKTYGTTVGFSHGEHAAHVAYYTEAIEREFPKGSGKPLTAKQRDKNTTVFYSTPMYSELENCGITGTARTKRVPPWIFGVSLELRLAFLRGYLDADGTVSKKGTVRFSSVNRLLLEDVRHLCMSAGIRCANLFSAKIASRFGKQAYTHVLWGFICTDDRIGSHTDWYRERIAQRLARQRPRISRVYPYEARERKQALGLQTTRVEAIMVEQLHQLVYNLSVAGTHNFVADGVHVLNSNIEQMATEFLQDTLRPWLVVWEQELARKLIRPLEMKQQLIRHNVDGMLRGDYVTRMQGYAIARQWGLMSADEVRALEEMNPLPQDQGTIYLTPANMVPADRIHEIVDSQVAPEPTAATPPVAVNPPNAPIPAAPAITAPTSFGRAVTPELIAAHRAVLVEALQRLVRKEAQAARRASKRGLAKFAEWAEAFYAKHEGDIAAVMRAGLQAHLSQIGSTKPVDAAAAELARTYVAGSRAELPTEPNELENAVDLLARRWESTRAAQLADGFMTEEVRHAVANAQ